MLSRSAPRVDGFLGIWINRVIEITLIMSQIANFIHVRVRDEIKVIPLKASPVIWFLPVNSENVLKCNFRYIRPLFLGGRSWVQ